MQGSHLFPKTVILIGSAVSFQSSGDLWEPSWWSFNTESTGLSARNERDAFEMKTVSVLYSTVWTNYINCVFVAATITI